MAALLVLSSLGAQLGVAPRIERARASLGPSLESVDPSDARRQAFGRLHGISVLLLGVGMVAAAGATWGSLASRTGARRELAAGCSRGPFGGTLWRICRATRLHAWFSTGARPGSEPLIPAEASVGRRL